MSYNSKYKGAEVESLLDSISNKVDKVDGKQLSTEDFTTALKNKLSGLNNYDDTAINQAVQSLQTQLNTLVSGNASTAIDSFNEIIAFLNGITDSKSLDSIIASIEQQIAGKMDKVTLAAVATSGNYNDLSNKPTIPTAVTESTVSGWGFTKNTGTYSKPSGGIPKTDLASAVQASLNKADTALQSYTEQYKGTVTGVKINGTTKTPSSGTVDIGNVVTGVKINGSTKSPSSGTVDLGTVITAHQDISGKQDKLVSGTNIKTINGQSLLGSGNIDACAYPVVNHGTNDTTFTLTPNTYHIWGKVTSLNLSLGNEVSGVVNEYVFQYSVGDSAPTLTFPETIVWVNPPTDNKVNTTYIVSIVNNIGLIVKT